MEPDDITPTSQTVPELTLTIGGRPYQAQCPKDAVWASVVASRSAEATGSDQTRAMFLFMGAALGSDSASELQRRLTNISDTVDLIDLVRAYNQCVTEWTPVVQGRFEALGLKFSSEIEATVVIGKQEQPSSRPARRAAAKANPRKAAVRKAPRAK